MPELTYNNLTLEQQAFVDLAKQGKNVLVDACIGSGKTTTIQAVCGELPKNNILYLTYNRRLLLEARDRIRLRNVSVHTFHSFAGTALTAAGVPCHSEREAPQLFSETITRMPLYDTVIVDEYQDLESNLAAMLGRICYVSWNMRPGFIPQFLVVGDMDQKIYDYTSFNVRDFIKQFMGSLTGGYERVDFTQCFRLPADYAAELGQAWAKSIIGVNPDCLVTREHDIDAMVDFIAKYEPKDILVLGGNNGARIEIQNRLEKLYPDRFNKNTVYSSTRDVDADTARLDTSRAAIFTTYDSAKGLERRICVVCDFTDKYLDARKKYSTRRDILKNLFLVAASRGKEQIVFYSPPWATDLKFARVGRLAGDTPVDMRPVGMSSAFDYKQHEDVEACLSCLKVVKVEEGGEKIETERQHGMIDLSMCVGIYAQAAFFENYDVDMMVRAEQGKALGMGKSVILPPYDSTWPLQKRILYLTALDTEQERYFRQIKKNYVNRESFEALKERLHTRFTGQETVEVPCSIVYTGVRHRGTVVGDKMLTGRCDVVNGDGLWELKFTSSLKPEHQLQAALYMIALGYDRVHLWNLYDGELQDICVEDVERFLSLACRCVSKGLLTAEMVRLPSGAGGRRILNIA